MVTATDTPKCAYVFDTGTDGSTKLRGRVCGESKDGLIHSTVFGFVWHHDFVSPDTTPQPETPVVYFAARYSRNAEMLTYAEKLAELGYDVRAEWITGLHDGTADEDCARIDFAEVSAADVVVSFTEQQPSGRNRGGRHVEFGIALALKKRCIVVGWRENVFHYLPQVEFVDTPQELFDLLERAR